jgi:hypothetical protein
MNRPIRPATRNQGTAACLSQTARLFALVICASASLLAQATKPLPTEEPGPTAAQPQETPKPAPAAQPQQPSLADTARHLRAQKPQDQAQSDPSHAQDLVNEMEEEQDDAGNAPRGFKTYRADHYKLRVPSPFTVGHDDGGTVLTSTLTEGARSLVMVGNGVFFAKSNSDEAFADYAERYTRIYSRSTSCTKTKIDGHEAYQCGLSSAKLSGQVVSGNAVFVRGANSVFPVFCAAPTDSWARDYYNKSKNAGQRWWVADTMEREDEKVRNTWQTCDLVVQSIHLKEDDRPEPKSLTKPVKATSPNTN